ncbi:MED14-domain-containing protein [Sporormia fimetaria CBS 119925]|uniref:Mediator of RNA polymerase II transcription subunit 14 n=1 Tax=Sporormia fimetaria CBS 119925 TaxID=1340428 RepID=A0A6A6VPT9_9PLEO|nr:MED14-domain-containing protein [Sporormia fimetaria CBS 119925]
MNQSGTDAQGDSRKRTHDGKLVNGEHTHRADAPPTDGTNPMSKNGAVVLPSRTADQFTELPPELAQVPTEEYRPMSKLFQRAAQKTFNELTALLNSMAQMEVLQQPNDILTNGTGGSGNAQMDPSETSQQKKKLIIDFAKNTRAKYIKLLVLSGWSKKYAADIAKLIDINQWAVNQLDQLNIVDHQLAVVKFYGHELTDRNSDVQTALEVLSKGKADWVPDMGFVPPKPMSAEKGLQLLRYLDTTLAIRLHSHEDLPRHLKNWRVGSGRATFTIENEFEMDLVTFTEDLSSPWLFVDIRLLFSPAPVIPAESRIFWILRNRCDRLMEHLGISGCFDFLCNFVLTHKINILKTQADKLSQTGWAGTLKVEQAHRGLVVQYWTGRPGKKSWIEIGVSTSKPKSGKSSWRGPPIASLTARWFRQGVEVTDTELEFDYANLSMERMLKKVIALHTKSILSETRDALPSDLPVDVSLSAREPSDCHLEVCLGRSDLATVFSLEPLTGRYIFRPTTINSAMAEQTILRSGNPTAAIAPAIKQMLARTLQDIIHRHALSLGWRPLDKVRIRLDTMKKALQRDVIRFSLYRPSGWTNGWALAAVVDSSGENWWVMKLSTGNEMIVDAEQLKLDRPMDRPPIDRPTLVKVERVAIQHLSHYVTIKELQRTGQKGFMRVEAVTGASLLHESTEKTPQPWSLAIRTSDVHPGVSGEGQWLDPYVSITCHGFTADYRKVCHVASGVMTKSVATVMEKLMATTDPSNFILHGDGKFFVSLTTDFAEPIIGQLVTSLRDIDRLRLLATVLQKREFKLLESSMRHVRFQYGEKLTATINLRHYEDVTLEFPSSNPHNRIAVLLTEAINNRLTSDKGQAFDHFCSILLVTRSILSTLAYIEESAPGNITNPAVHAHSWDHYRFTYADPPCSFGVKRIFANDKAMWQLEDHDKDDDKRPANLKAALADVFGKTGTRWQGLFTGLVADLDAIAEPLKMLHEALTTLRLSSAAKAPVSTADTKQGLPQAQRTEPPRQNQPPVKHETPAKPSGGVKPLASQGQPRSKPNMRLNLNFANNHLRAGPQNPGQHPGHNTNKPAPQNGGQNNGGSRRDAIQLD